MSTTPETTSNKKQETPDRCVKLMKLHIGETDPAANSLISMEMQDTMRTGFKRSSTGGAGRKNSNSTNRRKKSMDRIFGKIENTYIEEVDKSKLKGLPRRSLANDLDFAAFRNTQNQESDDEEAATSNNQDSNVVRMLDLKVGEQDPTTNSLVALEMQDTQKIGFRRKSTRKKSIDRIFQKIKKVHIVHEFDRTPLKGTPRRSLASNLDPAILRGDIFESDEEDDTTTTNERNENQTKGIRYIDENDHVVDGNSHQDIIKQVTIEKNRRRVSFIPYMKSSRHVSPRVRSSISNEPEKVTTNTENDKNINENDSDSSKVKVFHLNIGEKDPQAKTLIALEMQDTKRTGFKKEENRSGRRKKSIDRIFGRIDSIDVESGLKPAEMKVVKRRSLAADFDIAQIIGHDESESE